MAAEQLLLLPDFAPPDRPTARRNDVLRMAEEGEPEKFRRGFSVWLMDNWAIWTRFAFEADKVRARKRRHYSARTIGEYIRHSTALKEEGGKFKVNDHWWPSCARLYMELTPEARGFFETRGRVQ